MCQVLEIEEYIFVFVSLI